MSERAGCCCMYLLNASNFTRIYRARKSKLKFLRRDCYLSNFNFWRRTNIISRHSYRGGAIDLCKIAVHVAFNCARLQRLKSPRRFNEKQARALLLIAYVFCSWWAKFFALNCRQQHSPSKIWRHNGERGSSQKENHVQVLLCIQCEPCDLRYQPAS